MAGTWPPPPDLASIGELVAAADVEGFLLDGAPLDEYEAEAEKIFEAIGHFPTAELVPERLMPILEGVWQESFALNDDQIEGRRSELRGLADQIARFFGPEAQPTVRNGTA